MTRASAFLAVLLSVLLVAGPIARLVFEARQAPLELAALH